MHGKINKLILWKYLYIIKLSSQVKRLRYEMMERVVEWQYMNEYFSV